MSSPAKQPSIHAFFGGAKKPIQDAKKPSKEAKKPSQAAKKPSQEAKTEKLKPSQIQNIDKKRSAPTSPAVDKKSASQVRLLRYVLYSPVSMLFCRASVAVPLQDAPPTTPLKKFKRNHEVKPLLPLSSKGTVMQLLCHTAVRSQCVQQSQEPKKHQKKEEPKVKEQPEKEDQKKDDQKKEEPKKEEPKKEENDARDESMKGLEDSDVDEDVPIKKRVRSCKCLQAACWMFDRCLPDV